MTLSNPPDNPEAQRVARHMRMCKEIAEIAMGLAEAAAARAQTDLASNQAAPLAEGEVPAPAPRNPLASALLFTRLCRVIQNAISLENRLAAGLASPAAAPARNDPRRATLRCVIDNAVAGNPNQNTLKRQAFDRLDQALALDPDCEYPAEAIIGPICNDLGIKFDRLPQAAQKHANGSSHMHRRR
jgi:hypothetical protein